MIADDDLDFPLLTAAQVADEILGIPAKTVLNMARDTRIPSQKIGRHVRFSRKAVTAAVKRARELGQPL